MLLHVVITLVAIGIVLFVINRYIPMQETMKQILNVAVVLVVVWWLLKVSGLLRYLSTP